MTDNNGKIFTSDKIYFRNVVIEGLTKPELLLKLKENGILMNEYAKKIFSCERFNTSLIKYLQKTLELTVYDLGFPDGATLPHIFDAALKFNLELCEVEVAPYLRLEYIYQEDSYLENEEKHRAPNGSVTVASKILEENDDFPKGFYLRNIKGHLWLRGYKCDSSYVWKPDSHFIFCLRKY